MTFWIGLTLVSLCILAVHVMMQTNHVKVSEQGTPKRVVANPRDRMPQVTREAISWAAQRKLDRGTWMALQQQAMQDWEDACQCPEPMYAYTQEHYDAWYARSVPVAHRRVSPRHDYVGHSESATQGYFPST